MRRGLFLACLLAFAWPLHAGAADSRLGLEVDASTEARSCKTPEVLRAKVAERLGRDAFVPDGSSAAEADQRMRVAFTKNGTRWSADIALSDREGKPLGTRSLTHDGPTCDPLVTSVAVTIAVVLEELAPTPSPPPSPPPSPSPSSSTSEPPPSPPPSSNDRRFAIDASLGAAGAIGGAPAPSVGGEIDVGLSRARGRIEIGGRMFLPASSDGEVAVRTRLVYGRIAPCYGWDVLSACFVAALGSVSGEAQGEGVASSRLAGNVYAAGGIGALSRVFIASDIVFVRAALEVLFPFSRVGFDVGDTRVWTLPIASAAGTLALGARLP